MRLKKIIVLILVPFGLINAYAQSADFANENAEQNYANEIESSPNVQNDADVAHVYVLQIAIITKSNNAVKLIEQLRSFNIYADAEDMGDKSMKIKANYATREAAEQAKIFVINNKATLDIVDGGDTFIRVQFLN